MHDMKPETVTSTELASLQNYQANRQEVDLAALLEEAAALPPLAPMKLSDAEFEAFLKAIHE